MATIRERRTKDVVDENGLVSKKGETHYQAIVRLRGFPPQTATFRRKTDAKKWASKTENDIREGRYFRTAEARKHTLAELVDRYLRDVLPRKSATVRRQQRQQLTWWKQQLGAYTLADVTPGLLAEQRDKLARTAPSQMRRGKAADNDTDKAVADDTDKAVADDTDKTVADDTDTPEQEPTDRRSAGSVNRYLAALSHAFTVAVREWGWVDQSPVRKVDRLKEPRGRVRFLDDGERKRLLKACRNSEEPLLYPIVVLAISTGARQGEILNLRWQNIDFENCLVRIEETKNDERRSVPLTGLALEQLKELSRVRRIDTDLVFPHPDGVRPVETRTPWVKALAAAKITDFRFHDLRHSAASYLAMNGATLAEIAEILGHKTLQMVKRYAHLSEQHTSRVVAAMNERIFGAGQ